MHFAIQMESIGYIIDVFGIIVIILGTLGSTLWFLYRLLSTELIKAYTRYRQNVGRSILLGLEFLVAGDIIRTVAVAPSLMNVAILAGIVLIRTFLSMALQLEVEGRWPWQAEKPTLTQVPSL